MSEGKGKAVGGAAVGAGGIVAMVMKLCSAESTVAVKAAQGVGEIGVVARGAGEVGAIGAAGRSAGEIGALGHGASEIGAAGRSAGEIGALGHGAGAFVGTERGAGQIVLAGLSTPVEVSNLAPVGLHAAEDGARFGVSSRGLTPAFANGTKAVKVPTLTSAPSKAARAAKLRDALGHAVDAKDALDIVLDGWDIYQDSLDKDVETELNRKLAPSGLSSGDVLPAVKGEPVEGLAGATRLMLSDGHALVPAARLAVDARSSPLGATAKRAIVQNQGAPVATIYLAVPGDDLVMKATSLSSKLAVASISPKLEWIELVTVGPVKLPAILEQSGHRFVRLAVGGARVILLRPIPTATK